MGTETASFEVEKDQLGNLTIGTEVTVTFKGKVVGLDSFSCSMKSVDSSDESETSDEEDKEYRVRVEYDAMEIKPTKAKNDFEKMAEEDMGDE